MILRKRLGPLGVLSLLAVLSAAALAPAVRADEQPFSDRIVLTNGRTFDGRVIEETRDRVTLEMLGDTGACARMVFHRKMIARIERGVAGSGERASAGSVRDAWYLLKSGGAIVGGRHLVLTHVRAGGVAGWRLEETVEQFPRGPHVPAVRIQRTERVDLAFRPLQLYFREVGEGSEDPSGPKRYERSLSGDVTAGVWNALVHDGGGSEHKTYSLPPDGRARLSTREHLLRERTLGLKAVTLLDPGGPGLVPVRAGYTALDAFDDTGTRYDEFVWEENGVRLVSRMQGCEVVLEQVADGVTAVPANAAQVEAARQGAVATTEGPEPGLVALAETGTAFRLPDATWETVPIEVNALATGWRKIAEAHSRGLLADLRVEWNPTGAQVAPTADEAAQRLLQRLRAVCPDLRVLHTRQRVDMDEPGRAAWRMDFLGTLKGESIRTVAVMVDLPPGRALYLLACPEVSWAQASRSIEALVTSLRRL